MMQIIIKRLRLFATHIDVHVDVGIWDSGNKQFMEENKSDVIDIHFSIGAVRDFKHKQAIVCIHQEL